MSVSPSGPPSLAAAGRYYDGKTAAGRDVLLVLGSGNLKVAAHDGQIVDVWPLRDLDRVESDDTGMARLTCAGSAAEILCDDIALVAALRHGGVDCSRHRPALGWPKILAWSCAAAASVGLFFWFGLPLIARQVAETLPAAWETALGASTADQIIWLLSRPSSGTCDTPEGRAALDGMTAALTLTPPRLPIHVRVVDSPLVNALTLPGGQVLIMRGLLDFAEHPNELAGVLAHEIAHSDFAHPTEIAVKNGLGALAVGLLLGDVFGGSLVVALAQTLVTTSYSRDLETQADERMMETLRQAGLQSPPAAAFFERLVEEEGDIDGPFALLSTHPSSTVRAERLRRAVPLGTDALSEAEWQALKAICPMRPSRARPAGRRDDAMRLVESRRAAL